MSNPMEITFETDDPLADLSVIELTYTNDSWEGEIVLPTEEVE